ncbi:DUF1565 domain-containing protein [Paraflavitalea soli]|uniref:DUF1565 domain-containing protein n=2 Tax=Paraflavitalea soli TaxID=2315862 RepID=A0A3B7MMH6_9BACT|nr:DUF1565 domain-containing protein [Paraflavitalea soli]
MARFNPYTHMLKTILCTLLLSGAVCAQATIRYVKAGASGPGTDWSTASGDVQAMINASTASDEVWVAGGTYQRPTNSYFTMKEGVKVYGGFAGTETVLSQRDLSLTANTSTLQGNGRSVVYNDGNGLTNAAVLDGFTITGGQTTYGAGIFNRVSAPTISNCLISGNNATTMGGGIFNQTGAPRIINCTISNNKAPAGSGISNEDANAFITNCIISGNGSTAVSRGGGIQNRNTSDPIITNCSITGNIASQGGGVYNTASSPKLTNCTISANFANTAADGGAMYNASSATPRLRNSVLYGNSSGIFNTAGSTPDIQFCLVQGLMGTATFNIAGSSDPLFVNPLPPGISTGGDYRLQPCSPIINKGKNDYFAVGQSIDLSSITTDLDGGPRIHNGVKIDFGAYEFTGSNTGGLVLANSGDAVTATISAGLSTTAFTAACRVVAMVSPDGTGTTVSGAVDAKVWIESTQPALYVKRHYEITPALNAATATGKVTLYFTQAEFDDFNAVNTLQLPTGPTDATRIANLLIEKRAGTSSDGSGLPSTYSGASATIDPADTDIQWNATGSRWEVSIHVTGFSGFFAKTHAYTMPLRLLSFKGNQRSGYNQLQWATAEEINTRHFELESSTDGSSFTRIATIAAAGNGNNGYSYDDQSIHAGKTFYRLKMVDLDQRFTYSSVIAITNNSNNSLRLFPNPVSDITYIHAGNALLHSKATLHDANGRLLQTIIITTNPQPIQLQHLVKGLYVVQFADGTAERLIKQ